jgi:hypothetical protein
MQAQQGSRGTDLLILNLGVMWVKKKVKYTLVQALRLCTGCMAHRGSRGVAVLHDRGTRRG